MVPFSLMFTSTVKTLVNPPPPSPLVTMCKILLFIYHFYCFILGLIVTETTFEEQLAYDEIFVEYFNAFLALPVSCKKRCCTM